MLTFFLIVQQTVKKMFHTKTFTVNNELGNEALIGRKTRPCENISFNKKPSNTIYLCNVFLTDCSLWLATTKLAPDLLTSFKIKLTTLS